MPAFQPPGHELAEQAFSDARLQVIAAGAVMGLAANPVLSALSVAGALADLSVTTRTQVFAAACAAELILPAASSPGFLDRDSARLELLVPVFGTSSAPACSVSLVWKSGCGWLKMPPVRSFDS